MLLVHAYLHSLLIMPACLSYLGKCRRFVSPDNVNASKHNAQRICMSLLLCPLWLLLLLLLHMSLHFHLHFEQLSIVVKAWLAKFACVECMATFATRQAHFDATPPAPPSNTHTDRDTSTKNLLYVWHLFIFLLYVICIKLALHLPPQGSTCSHSCTLTRATTHPSGEPLESSQTCGHRPSS